MYRATASAPKRAPDYAACSGCGLCLLVCPVWRRDHDLALTPLARARALQHGAGAADLAASVQGCTLCAACEPVCPEEIGLVEMTLDLRRVLPPLAAAQALHDRMLASSAAPSPAQAAGSALFLPGRALRERPATLARATALLAGAGGIALAADDGDDIALAAEAAAAIPASRLEQFLRPLRAAGAIVVTDGLLLRRLRQWLPKAKLSSIGAALSAVAAVRRALRVGDLYVIEARAYHADYQRLVKHYDALHRETGCMLNLDLQRIAIPATARSLAQRLGMEAATDGAQARWILHGRKVARIVVENPEDAAAFAGVCDHPVVHLADLAEDRPL